jgi:hypothetical protein
VETIHAQVPLRGKPGIAFDEKLEPLLAAVQVRCGHVQLSSQF